MKQSQVAVKFSRILPLVGALCAGAGVRLYFVLRYDFPLNDGGLFYLMTQELQRARYALPAYTTYNNAGIPFAYPPLGFYLAGLLADLTRWPLLDIFRFLPLAINILTIVPFYRLSRSLLPSPRAQALALFAFVLLPGSFTWQIMGGGVTRSLGFFFATLTLDQAYRLYTCSKKKHMLLTALWAAGAVLSHLAMAWAAALGVALLFLAYGRNRRGIVRSFAVAVGTLALTAPWWATIILRHGLAPLVAAGQSPEPIIAGLVWFLMLRITDEPFFPLLAALALLGLLWCLSRKRFLLPAWLAAICVLDPRTANTTATIPLALLAGLGIVEMLLPALSKEPDLATTGQGGTEGSIGDHGRGWMRSKTAQATLVFIFTYALYSSLTGGLRILTALPQEEREAMRWIAENTPPSSTFLVITGDRVWGEDRSSEWFPVLAERRSVATVQGTEWYTGFADNTRDHTTAQNCANQTGDCLEAWSRKTGVDFTYVYVVKSNRTGNSCQCLQASLHQNARYRMVYDGPSATVYARLAQREQ